MIRIILCLSIFSTSAYAYDIVREGSSLFLNGDCDKDGGTVKALSTWAQKMGEGQACNFKAVQNGLSANCSYDITHCVPQHVLKYHKSDIDASGPNCWNLSLVMSKILPNMRYSSPEEMAFYMKPPLCRQLIDSEKREPGDVGAIRYDGKIAGLVEHHGFIYVSDKMAYSKNGPSAYSPYALMPLEEVYNSYEIPDRKECRKNEIQDNAKSCEVAVAYFRCQSMDSYIQSHPNVSKEIKEAFEKVQSTEKCLQESLMAGDLLPKENRKNLIETSEALLRYLEDKKGDTAIFKAHSEEDRFILGSLQLRLQAIGTQLNTSNPYGLETETSEIINDLVTAMKKSQAELHARK